MLVSYFEYVREFKWESLKYATKRTLNELAIAIQKQMHQKDEQIRKQMDEFNGIKNKIQTLSKKDVGSLAVRDFTDEIYNKNVPAEMFVESHNSEMFANLLFVLNVEKFD